MRVENLTFLYSIKFDLMSKPKLEVASWLPVHVPGEVIWSRDQLVRKQRASFQSYKIPTFQTRGPKRPQSDDISLELPLLLNEIWFGNPWLGGKQIPSGILKTFDRRRCGHWGKTCGNRTQQKRCVKFGGGERRFWWGKFSPEFCLFAQQQLFE